MAGRGAQVLEFVRRRLEVVLAEGGVPLETVRAVLQQRSHDPALAASAVRQLQARPPGLDDEMFMPIRCERFVQPIESTQLNSHVRCDQHSF